MPIPEDYEDRMEHFTEQLAAAIRMRHVVLLVTADPTRSDGEHFVSVMGPTEFERDVAMHLIERIAAKRPDFLRPGLGR